MSSLRELFQRQRSYIDRFFDAIDLAEVEAVFETLKKCSGAFIFSGVGKSGLIAQKIAATFVSTGTRAHYLPCGDALHGDIGVVGPNDLFIALSKSGESEELINLLPYVEQKGAKTIAVVSKRGSRLEKKCTQSIYLPVERELCPFDLAPTTSTAIQLLFCDILAVGLMEARGFSIADFALNHPAGLLGKKITLKVSDLMLKGEQIPLCRPSDRLLDVLHELSAKRCGSVIIADLKGELKGIFTDGDLRRSIQSRGPSALEVPISELMTPSPKAIGENLLALDAMKIMEEDPSRPITVLPVLKEGQVVGILRMHDVLQTGPYKAGS